MTILLNRREAFRAAAAVALDVGTTLPARPQEPHKETHSAVVDTVIPRDQRGFYRVGEPTENGLSQGHAWYEATPVEEHTMLQPHRAVLSQQELKW